MAFRVGTTPTQRGRQPRDLANPAKHLLIPPASYVTAVRRTLGDIDLDPCSTDIAQQHIDAGGWYRASDALAALAEPWAGRVFLHPHPDLRTARSQLQKLLRDYLADRVTAALILANTTDWLRVEPILASFPFLIHYRQLKYWRYDPARDELDSITLTSSQHQLTAFLPHRNGNHFDNPAIERFCSAFRSFGRPIIAEDLGDDWQAEALIALQHQAVKPLLPSAKLERYGEAPGALIDILADEP